MVVVVIGGVPKSLKFPRFLAFVKHGALKNIKYDVNFTTKIMNDGTKQMSFNLKSNDARAAVRFINGYNFRHAKIVYPLKCWIQTSKKNEESTPIDFEEPMQNNVTAIEEYEPPQKTCRYSNSPARSRSHSPFYSNELRDIEVKIELVRKQRILLEEETKLLLEKRKLEYLKNVGINDCANLSKFKEICRRYDNNEISEFADASPKNPIASAKLPSFLGPCKEITTQMQTLVRSNTDINSENRSLFWNLLRSTLKKRLAIVMDGKGYISTRYIVSLYRAKYPLYSDAELVDELLNTISKSCWPKQDQNKNVETDVTNDDGQNNELENPGADAQEIELDTTAEQAIIDDSQCVNLDEFVDLDDVENWVKDEGTDETSPVKNSVALSKDEDETIQSEIAKETAQQQNEPSGEENNASEIAEGTAQQQNEASGEENDASGVKNSGDAPKINADENSEEPKNATVDVDKTDPAVEEDGRQVEPGI